MRAAVLPYGRSQNGRTVLVTGASGMLGANFMLSAEERGWTATGVYHRHPVHFPRALAMGEDLTKESAALGIVRSVHPSWVLHCAAATDVDWCQDHPDEAWRANVLATRNLAAAAREADARFVYLSTDAVFDGTRGGYAESDSPAPVNIYGKTKWEGEKAAWEILKDPLVVRTCIYGWSVTKNMSLAEWVLARLELGEIVPGFHDVIFSPILVNDLNEIIFDMIERKLEGVYHVTGSKAVTKYEFARRIARTFGFDPDSVAPISVETAQLRAPRPRNTSLRTDRARKTLKREMPDVDSGIRRFKAFRDKGFLEELRSCRGG